MVSTRASWVGVDRWVVDLAGQVGVDQLPHPVPQFRGEHGDHLVDRPK